MQGMMLLYASNVIFLEKTDFCARHVLEDFDLKTNFKGHAETGLLILFSSLGCVVLPPMVSSNFLGGCPNHAQTMGKSGKKTHAHHAHLDDIHEMWLSRHGPWDSWTSIGLFFPLVFENSGQRLQKKSRQQKQSQWGSMSGWDMCCFFHFFGFVFRGWGVTSQCMCGVWSEKLCFF